MFRVLVVLYSLDVLPEVMAELKKRGLATRFTHDADSVKGEWTRENPSLNVLSAMRCVQMLYGVKLRLEVDE